jgi:HlyD family secretion protein
MMLTKYKEAGEIVAPGQPLFKMANLDNITLRAYVSGNQISEFTLGRTVSVSFDGPDGIQETPGQVTWISPQAEFTPKIIQTREERISLVYAIKITVPNTGQIKIGMPGEVNLP